MFQFDHVRTRFAPSPTGYMHVGNLRTALFAYLVAKSNNGRFLLRIEDTDQERQVEGAVEIIYKTLKETGLLWDEGPDIGGPVGPYIQSQRMDMFKAYAEKLVESGHAYYCFCDKERLEEVRKVQEASGIAPRYDGHCRNLSKEEVAEKLAAGVPYVIRQKVPTEGTVTFHDEVYGDVTVDCSTLDDQILIGGVAVALGELVGGIPHDGCAVDILGDLPAEGLIQQVVLGGGGKIFVAADDVGDAHGVVVHHVGKVVGGQSIAL